MENDTTEGLLENANANDDNWNDEKSLNDDNDDEEHDGENASIDEARGKEAVVDDVMEFDAPQEPDQIGRAHV